MWLSKDEEFAFIDAVSERDTPSFINQDERLDFELRTRGDAGRLSMLPPTAGIGEDQQMIEALATGRPWSTQ